MAEEKASPISAVKPPVSNPLKPAGAGHASTLKLKPVIRKPALGGETTGVGAKLPVKPVTRAVADTPAPAPAAAAPAAPAAEPPKSLDQLKSVTQRLKDVTQEIPQQAILRKTGIIGDQELTAAQKQAAKARTARISLSDAIGVAPVKEAAPMKTIRIKRPLDIPGAAPAAAPAAAGPAPAAEPEEEPAATVTQKKTLKISRPGGVRPGPKLGIKKPGAPAPAAPAEGAAEGGEVADIPDIPDMPAANPFMAPPPPASDVPKAVALIGLIVQIAACAVMGALAWFLYQDWQIPCF